MLVCGSRVRSRGQLIRFTPRSSSDPTSTATSPSEAPPAGPLLRPPPGVEQPRAGELPRPALHPPPEPGAMPRRPRRLRYRPPPLTEDLILAWADREHALTGRWPTSTGGEVAAAPAEKWRSLDAARGPAPAGPDAPLLLTRQGFGTISAKCRENRCTRPGRRVIFCPGHVGRRVQ